MLEKKKNKTITLKAKDVDWNSVAARLIKFREMVGLDNKMFADMIGLRASDVSSYESGRNRKSFGSILQICVRCRLSARWLLTGKGQPFRRFKEPPVVDPFAVDKGPGMRRSNIRKETEEGIMDKEMLDFVLALNKLKTKNHKPFATSSEIFQLIHFLGYRKVAHQSLHIDLKE